MLRTLDEWYEYAIERGTSGDMVFDILKDWQESRTVRCPECWQDISEMEFSVDSEVSGHMDVGYNCPKCNVDVYTYRIDRSEYYDED